MITRAVIGGDWSIGPTGSVACELEVEPLRSDARAGSEADGLSLTVPITVHEVFDPPPIGQTIALIDDAGETLATGVIESIGIAFDNSIRVSIDL